MIRWLRDQEEELLVYTAPKRLYVNQDRSRLVEESDPEAFYLLVAQGGKLTDAVARQYGLIDEDGEPVEAAEAPEPAEETLADDEPGTKAQRPAANKARQPSENK